MLWCGVFVHWGQLHGCSLVSHALYLTNLASRVYVVYAFKTVALLLTSIETNYVKTNFYGLRQHHGNQRRGIGFTTETKQVHLNGVMFPFLKQREALRVFISVQNDGVHRKQPLVT